MLRKLFVLPLVGLLMLPAMAQAQYNEGDWDFTLSGQGFSNKDVNAGNFAATVGIGYMATREVEFALRQSFGYSDNNAGTDWTGATIVAADYHFDLDQWQPFVGVHFGYVYGDAVSDFWQAGPEAGVKYFVNETTYVYGIVQYLISLDDYDDSEFAYGLGVGFKC